MTIEEFAEKVERLCEFLLEKVPASSDERKTIWELKEAAADIQSGIDHSNVFEGLSNHVRGIYIPPKEQ